MATHRITTEDGSVYDVTTEDDGAAQLHLPPASAPVSVPQPSPQSQAIARIRAVDPGYAQMQDQKGWAPDPISDYRVFHAADSQPLDDSVAGAFGRGLKSSALPAAAGLVSGAVGSVIPFMGLPSAIGGGAVAAGAQNTLFPPDAHDIAQAQFDEANHKAARIGGEFAPALATLKPSIKSLLPSTIAATGGKSLVGPAIGMTAGAGIPAAISAYQGQPLDAARIATGAVTGALGTPNKLSAYLLSKDVRTGTAANKMAERTVQTAASDPKLAAQNIAEGATQLNTGGVNIPTGVLSKDAGLEALQQTVRGFDPNKRIATTERNNERAVAQNFADANAPQGAPPEAAAAHFAQTDAAALKAVQDKAAMKLTAAQADAAQRLTQAKTGGVELPPDALPAANAELDAARAPITGEGSDTVRTKSGSAVHEILSAAKDAAKVPVQEAYSKVDPNLPTTFENTHAAVKKMAASVGENGEVPDIIRKMIATRDPKAGPKPFSELQADLRAVNEKLREANAAGKDNSARMLGAVKDGLNADMEALGSNAPELRAANEMHRAYAEKFKQGAVGEILKKGKAGAASASAPSDSIDRAMRTPEGAKQLAATIGSDPAAKDSVRDWFVNSLAKVSGKAPTAESTNKWLRANASELQHFPDVRKEVGQMANRLGNGSKVVGAIEKELEARRFATAVSEAGSSASLKAVEKTNASDIASAQASAKEHPASAFADTHSDAAIASVMESRGKAAIGVRRLLDKAALDSTGAATEGVKNAVRSWLNSAARNARDTSAGHSADVSADSYKVSSAKLSGILLDSDKRAALEHAFGKKTVNAYEQGLKQIQAQEGGLKSGQGGSDTAERSAAGAAANNSIENGLGVLNKAIRGGVGQRSSGQINATLGDATNLLARLWKGDYRTTARKMLVDAQLDPVLMQKLLRPAGKGGAAASDIFRTYVPGKSEKDDKAPDAGPLPGPKK